MIYLSNFPQLIIIKSKTRIILFVSTNVTLKYTFLNSFNHNEATFHRSFIILPLFPSIYIYAKLLYSHQLRKHSPDKIFQNGKKNDDEISNCWIPRNDQTLVKWSIPVDEYKHHYKNFQRLANKLNADIKSSVR